MFVSILVSALLVVVCPSVIAITLPNGFVFDETPYLTVESRAKAAVEKCERPTDGCSSDCSAHLQCDGNYNEIVSSSYPCPANMPFCVKNTGPYTVCSGNFPMNNEACLTRATNKFVCTADGEFPDPTDCTKYHVCNGTAHSIIECPANSQFLPDPNLDLYSNPGNGKFICRFRIDHDVCYCEGFYCDEYSYANSFSFRSMDSFHYAYCLQIGTLKKTVMFKCPKGTRHFGVVSTMTNSVDCVPVDAPIV